MGSYEGHRTKLNVSKAKVKVDPLPLISRLSLKEQTNSYFLILGEIVSLDYGIDSEHVFLTLLKIK